MSELPQKRMLQLFKIIKELQAQGQKIQPLADKIGSTYRTTLRYIRIIQKVGINIRVDADGKYYIEDSKCPCCLK